MRLPSILLACALFTSCSASKQQQMSYMNAYHSSSLAEASSKSSEVLKKAIPNFSFRESKDAVWMLLDSGTLHLANGEVGASVEAFRLALEAIDYYDQECFDEILAQVALQDDVAAYIPDDYEQVLARLYFSLALFANEDAANAQALLRQAEAFQQRRQEEYRDHPLSEAYQIHENAMCKLLFAACLEHSGDHSNARILYKDAKKLLGDDLAHYSLTNGSEKHAKLILVCHNGKRPKKISRVSRMSQASTIALEYFMDDLSIHEGPTLTSLSGIATPCYCDWQDGYTSPVSVCVNDSQTFSCMPCYDVAAAARAELEQKMPVLVAKGAARYLLRRSLVAAANSKDSDMGAFMDVAMYITNAATEADTRSWASLPYKIEMLSLDLPEGIHDLTVRVGPYEKHVKLDLRSRDFCVLNLFTFLPDTCQLIVPKTFMIQEGELL